jgi:hypothetical protein
LWQKTQADVEGVFAVELGEGKKNKVKPSF